MSTHAEDSSDARRGWISPVLWASAFLAALGTACIFSPDLREIVLEGIGYMWAFFTTPFILEASVALIGLCVVFIINNLRIAREGDGWVEMEIKPDPPSTASETDPSTPRE